PILQFGGQPLPNGQGTLNYINLNDVTNWTWMTWASGSVDHDFIQHVPGHFLWRAKGAFLGQDAALRRISLPMRYLETNVPLGTALAQLSQAGVQNLSFDGLTAIQVKFAGARQRQLLKKYLPYYWSLSLEFLAVTPWFQDLTSTGTGAIVVTAPGSVGASSGAVTIPPPIMQILRGARIWQGLSGAFSPLSVTTTPAAFTIAYAGSVFTEPIFTLTVPSVNTGVISTFTLTNTTSGEMLQ